MRIEWLRDLSRIEGLRDAWRGLEKRVQRRTIYSRYDYVLPWYHCYAGTRLVDRGSPLVGTAWNGDELIAVAPLVEARASFARIPLRRAVSVGYNLDCGEMLMDETAAVPLTVFAEELLTDLHLDLVIFNGVDTNLKAYDDLVLHLNRQRVRHEHIPYAWVAMAQLEDGYQAYAQRRGPNFRRQVRKIALKVAAAGRIQLDRVAGHSSMEEVLRLGERMFAISERSWRVSRSSLAHERMHQPFYRELLDVFGPQGAVDLSIVVLDGRDAAFSLGIVERGIYYHTLVGFDDELRAYSPGTHLLNEVFKLLPESGVKTVLSHGNYDYKRRWASEIVPQRSLYIFNRTFGATLGHFVGFSLRRVQRQLEFPSEPEGGERLGSP